MLTTDTPAFPVDFAAARQPQSDAAYAVLAAEKTGEGGIKGIQIGKSDVYEVSPANIHVQEGWNGRDFSLPENQEHVEALAHSIAAKGVQVPLTAYFDKVSGKLYLTDGESRLRAVWHAINVLGKAITAIPVRMEARGQNELDRIANQLVRNSGKPFTPMEKATVVRRLMSHGWTVEKVAEEVGLRPGRINDFLELLELPEPVRQSVAHGEIAATEAVRVVREHGEAAPAIVEAAVAASHANGGKKAGKATRATLRAVASARDDILPKLTLPALLSILKKAKEDAIEQKDGAVEIRIEAGDWERICAAF